MRYFISKHQLCVFVLHMNKYHGRRMNLMDDNNKWRLGDFKFKFSSLLACDVIIFIFSHIKKDIDFKLLKGYPQKIKEQKTKEKWQTS